MLKSIDWRWQTMNPGPCLGSSSNGTQHRVQQQTTLNVLSVLCVWCLATAKRTSINAMLPFCAKQKPRAATITHRWSYSIYTYI